MQPIFIAGPCVIESATLLNTVAHELVRINRKYGINIIFKASFDKANRTSIHSFRGPGLDKGLQMLADIKAEYGLQILTDIHESCQAEAAGEVCDVLQIPAFLCRQTDISFSSKDRKNNKYQESTVPKRCRHALSCGESDGKWS